MPRRTQGGYRLFSESDLERLQTILRLQRDEFLPLRVIKDELDAPGAKERKRRRPTALGAAEESVTLDELCERAVIDPSLAKELEDFGLLAPHGSGGEKRYPSPTSTSHCSARSSRASASGRGTCARFAPRRRDRPRCSSRCSRRRCAVATASGVRRPCAISSSLQSSPGSCRRSSTGATCETWRSDRSSLHGPRRFRTSRLPASASRT